MGPIQGPTQTNGEGFFPPTLTSPKAAMWHDVLIRKEGHSFLIVLMTFKRGLRLLLSLVHLHTRENDLLDCCLEKLSLNYHLERKKKMKKLLSTFFSDPSTIFF